MSGRSDLLGALLVGTSWLSLAGCTDVLGIESLPVRPPATAPPTRTCTPVGSPVVKVSLRDEAANERRWVTGTNDYFPPLFSRGSRDRGPQRMFVLVARDGTGWVELYRFEDADEPPDTAPTCYSDGEFADTSPICLSGDYALDLALPGDQEIPAALVVEQTASGPRVWLHRVDYDGADLVASTPLFEPGVTPNWPTDPTAQVLRGRIAAVADGSGETRLAAVVSVNSNDGCYAYFQHQPWDGEPAQRVALASKSDCPRAALRSLVYLPPYAYGFGGILADSDFYDTDYNPSHFVSVRFGPPEPTLRPPNESTLAHWFPLDIAIDPSGEQALVSALHLDALNKSIALAAGARPASELFDLAPEDVAVVGQWLFPNDSPIPLNGTKVSVRWQQDLLVMLAPTYDDNQAAARLWLPIVDSQGNMHTEANYQPAPPVAFDQIKSIAASFFSRAFSHTSAQLGLLWVEQQATPHLHDEMRYVLLDCGY